MRSPAVRLPQRFQISLGDRFLHFGVKLLRPGKRRVPHFPVDAVEIVDQVPAAQDEHPAFAQFLQFTAKRDVFGKGALVIQAQLKHRHIRLRVDVPQNAPGSVVQAPSVIGEQVMLQSQALGLFRCAGCRVPGIALRTEVWGNRRNRESCGDARRSEPGCRE